MNEEIIDNRDVVIYCLKDPRPERGLEVRYIGKTVSPLIIRVQGHCDDQANTRKTAWIKSLKKLGLRPVIEQLDVAIGGVGWSDMEIGWIKYGREEGWRLTNHTTGGERGFVLNEESRAKISKALTGKVVSEETKEKLRIINTGKRKSQETLTKMSELMKGRRFNTPWIDKIRLAHRKLDEDKAAAILHRFEAGEQIKILSAEYGVSTSTIRKVLDGVYFKCGQDTDGYKKKYGGEESAYANEHSEKFVRLSNEEIKIALEDFINSKRTDKIKVGSIKVARDKRVTVFIEKQELINVATEC